jgi:hypothetical protein
VDREAGDVIRRGHFRWVEFDHQVVQAVTDSGHGAEGAIARAFSDDVSGRSATVAGGKTDQVADFVPADSPERAVTSCDDDAGAATYHDFVVSSSNTADGRGDRRERDSE